MKTAPHKEQRLRREHRFVTASPQSLLLHDSGIEFHIIIERCMHAGRAVSIFDLGLVIAFARIVVAGTQLIYKLIMPQITRMIHVQRTENFLLCDQLKVFASELFYDKLEQAHTFP